jgi:hypothetical protein
MTDGLKLWAGRTCCCPHPDAGECARSRGAAPLDEGRNEYERSRWPLGIEDRDERCECRCHDRDEDEEVD